MSKKIKKILILGGGVAGASTAYYLMKKGYQVTIIERHGKKIGGLARTYKYGGHPYEFGPHIWFWPDPSPINDTIRDLTDNKLRFIDRKLLTYVAKDKAAYNYPIHFSDIGRMPEVTTIHKELKEHRDSETFKLLQKNLPKIGECTFEEYFIATVGKTLYEKFMKDYSHKMWNIPGDELQTSMVWADRIKHNYEKLKGYDPIKFEDHSLGKGLPFQVYPEKGWNVVWDNMVRGAKIIPGKVHHLSKDNYVVYEHNYKNNISTIEMSNYYAVISTLDIDRLFEWDDELPYTGRIMIPLLLPNKVNVFNGIESIHYSGKEFQTRVTEMDIVTGYKSNSTLILLEVPITVNAKDNMFPSNTIEYAKKNNLYARRAYPQQSKLAIESHSLLIEYSKKNFPNLFHIGRHAEFRYMGMPETVDSVYNLVESQF